MDEHEIISESFSFFNFSLKIYKIVAQSFSDKHEIRSLHLTHLLAYHYFLDLSLIVCVSEFKDFELHYKQKNLLLNSIPGSFSISDDRHGASD